MHLSLVPSGVLLQLSYLSKLCRCWYFQLCILQTKLGVDTVMSVYIHHLSDHAALMCCTPVLVQHDRR